MKDDKLDKVQYPLSLAAFDRLTLVNYGSTADRKELQFLIVLK